jgi:hypothetical protein
MRFWGSKQVPEIPVFPDTVMTVVVTSAAQAADYPTGVDLVRVTFSSTVGGNLAGVFNPSSTGAAWGTSASGTAGSSQSNVMVGSDSRMFQRPRTSTGYSIVASSNALCTLEFWSKAGTT